MVSVAINNTLKWKKNIDDIPIEKEILSWLDNIKIMKPKKIIVKSYNGKYSEALLAFKKDTIVMERVNYFPISQTWTDGSYSFGAFLGALLLCIIFIGVIVFIYMLIVKPAGTLTVTYELRSIPDELHPENSLEKNEISNPNNMLQKTSQTKPNSNFDKMMELKKMFDSGFITEKEFNEKRLKILNKL